VTQVRVTSEQVRAVSIQFAVGSEDIDARYQPSTGSHRVTSGLSSWCSGWEDGRRKIGGEVRSLSSAAIGVAEDYLHGETVISTTLTK
jgi:hypothetical protein